MNDVEKPCFAVSMNNVKRLCVQLFWYYCIETPRVWFGAK